MFSHRILLESFFHDNVSFVTLTYDEGSLPDGESLRKEDAQDFMKRLRFHSEKKLRYFLVGEYGDQSGRPHYHAAIFGLSGCKKWPGDTKYHLYERSRCKCVDCSLLRYTWQNGKTDNGTLKWESAQYLCKYITKRMTSNKNDRQKDYLQGRKPEFRLMSLKPGIGALSVERIGELMLSDFGTEYLIRNGDVPNFLQHGQRKLPLGRYLMRKVREYYGFKEVGAQPGWAHKKALSELSEDLAFEAQTGTDAFETAKRRKESRYQSILNIEAKEKLNRKGFI